MKAWQAGLMILVGSGCGGKEESEAPESSSIAPPVAQAPVTNSPAPSVTNPPVAPTNTMPAEVAFTNTVKLVCTAGTRRPYTGKVIQRDAKNNKVAEGEYVDGLEHGHYREWYSSGKLKTLWRLERGQLVARQVWLENGKQVDLRLQGWSAAGTPYVGPARKLQLSVGGGKLNLENYRRHPIATLQIGLGRPDEVDGRVWIYRGLNIKHATTDQAHTIAKFTILDGRVLAVTVE